VFGTAGPKADTSFSKKMNEVIIEVYGMSTCIHEYMTAYTVGIPPLDTETTQNVILNWSGTLPDAAGAPAEEAQQTITATIISF
jgi:hypothetical protein